MTSRVHDDTRSQNDETSRLGEAPGADFLTLTFQAEQPRGRAVRLDLYGVQTVEVGRGEELRVTRPSVGVVRLEVPDPWMSREHLRLERAGLQVVAIDRSTKNGTLVDLRRVERAPLASGARIEIGRSVFVYRRTDGDRAVPRGDRIVAWDDESGSVTGFTTLNPDLEATLADVAAAADSRLPIELRGGSGTGKEVLARAVHRASGRPGPFVAVNCAALPASLVESELFGVRRGAFTGAIQDRPGLFQMAHGGTLFLDEIGDLPLQGQASLLRALQEGEARPLGATRAVVVDFRLITATHRSLDEMAQLGEFRADLLARLGGLAVVLPPLVDRIEDLGLLVAKLLERAATGSATPSGFTIGAMRMLFTHRFPLNVRELERALAAATLLAGGGRIGTRHFPVDWFKRAAPAASTSEPAGPEPGRTGPTLSEADQAHRSAIEEALARNGGNVAAVARDFGKGRMQVHRWLKRYGLLPDAYRG